MRNASVVFALLVALLVGGTALLAVSAEAQEKQQAKKEEQRTKKDSDRARKAVPKIDDPGIR